MSGLLALLDDVAAIAKVAAASLDDIGAAALKAGGKAAGVVIDDAAVTPKYVTGLAAARELPMIGRIALGSLRNKIVILLPLLLVLQSFLPQIITPLLMLGGAYLCFEGAEKILHRFWPAHGAESAQLQSQGSDPTQLEERQVAGAIKTDFILSAEIMVISLSVIDSPDLWVRGATLALVGIAITVLVYGAVALIVRMDDLGLWLAKHGRSGAGRAFGRGLVRFMPRLLTILSVVGTAAMLWVGGSILVHGLHETGLSAQPGHWISLRADAAAAAVSGDLAAITHWLVTAFFDGIFGLLVGGAIYLCLEKLLHPLWRRLRPAR